MVRASVVFALFALMGCRPDFDDRPSEIDRLRVLAIRSDPPEAAAGASVTYTALVADGQGGYRGLALDWAFCTKPRPLDEPNAVSVKCFAAEAGWIEPIGVGDSVTGVVPNNACRQFGSDVPEPKEGEPPGRPADPDPTGGYYQPTRLLVPSDPRPLLALGQTRLICGLPGATREVSEKYRRLYRPNVNPAIESVDLVGTGPVSNAVPARIAAHSKVYFRVIWPETCPTDTGCGAAENYLQYDLVTRDLIDRRESMRVSFVSNGGTWDQDRTGREENDPNAWADDGWTAPATPGRYEMFAVLRDSRGGVDWRAFSVVVE